MPDFFGRQVEQRNRCQFAQAEDLQGPPLAEVAAEARPQAQEDASADKHLLALDDLMGEKIPIDACLPVHLLPAVLPASLQDHVALTAVQSWALARGLSLLHGQDDLRYLSHSRDKPRPLHVRVADLAG